MHHRDVKGIKNPFYGHKWNAEQRNLIPKSHIGKHLSEKIKLEMSKARIEYYKNNPDAIPKGEKNPMYGRHPDSQMKRRLQIASIEYYQKHPEIRRKLKLQNSGLGNPFYGKHHSLETRKIMVEKRRHRVIPYIDTKLEQKFQSKLISLDISFEKHKPIYGQPDIFIEPNICIFIDGCFWHACKTCKKGIQNKNYIVRRKIDKQITKKLKLEGYEVHRFWEHEINSDIEKCAKIALKNVQLKK